MLKNLLRDRLPEIPQAERENVLNHAKLLILQVVQPLLLYAVGSSVSGRFDAESDLDFVVVFDSAEAAEQGRRILYREVPVRDRIAEYICVDRHTFDRKSDVGGILFIAKHHGKLLYEATL